MWRPTIALLITAFSPGQAEPLFKPVQVIPGGFPPIRDVPVVRGSDVDPSVVRDDELVLGVVVGGEARAYPINMLTGPSREIVNDRLGGQAIAATW